MSWPAFMYLHSKMRVGMGAWRHLTPGYQCQYNKSWSFLLTSVQCIWEWELIMSRNLMKDHDFPLWCWPQCSVYLFLILLNIEVKQYVCFHTIYLVSTNTFLGTATDPCNYHSSCWWLCVPTWLVPFWNLIITIDFREPGYIVASPSIKSYLQR